MVTLSTSTLLTAACISIQIEHAMFPWQRWLHEHAMLHYYVYIARAVAQWLRCFATNWKVAGSIPGGVIGIFH